MTDNSHKENSIMNIHKSYNIGFRKTAKAYGVNPGALVKIAREGILSGNSDPAFKRALLGALLSGAGTYAFTDGAPGKRLLKGLAGGLVGGAATYGLDQLGVLDKILPGRRY